MTTPGIYIGIDVAKAELVVATATTAVCRVANDRAGYGELLRRLAGMTVKAVVLESTGCYGQPVVAFLQASGVPVAVVQPGRVRHFACSQGIHAKTDPMDAKVIAQFAAATTEKLRLYQPPALEVVHLRALVDRRDQIIDLRKQEENHLEANPTPCIAKDLRASIKRLFKAEKGYTKHIADHLARHDRLARLSKALQEECGVGLQTAATVLAHLPELGTLNRQKSAALAGVAPFNDSSGTKDGKRTIYGGRKRLRRALYMAALSAVRFSTWIKEIYAKLRARGKPAKIAIIACARKLLVRLNTIAANVLKTPMNPQQTGA